MYIHPPSPFPLYFPCPHHCVNQILVIFLGSQYFDHRYLFVNTDSGLSAYCDRSANLPNVWWRYWQTPIYSVIIKHSSCHTHFTMRGRSLQRLRYWIFHYDKSGLQLRQRDGQLLPLIGHVTQSFFMTRELVNDKL